MYVLFREPRNPNTATPTTYLTRDRLNNFWATTSRKRAIKFETSALAYQFAAENNVDGSLDSWRVGER